eukprot:g9974.t1
MLARVLDPGSITRLLKGILEASCRALFVLNKAAREFADSDPSMALEGWGGHGSEFALRGRVYKSFPPISDDI